MNILDKQDSLHSLMHNIYNVAQTHGWHEHDEEKHSTHWLALILSEIGEAIDADRLDKRADMQAFDVAMHGKYATQKNFIKHGIVRNNYNEIYDKYIKGTIEEEFADIAMRLLDYAMVHMIQFNDDWKFMHKQHTQPVLNNFPLNAWNLATDVLKGGCYVLVSNSLEFMYDWSEQLGIDLDLQMRLKLEYNRQRPYKHGGKRY